MAIGNVPLCYGFNKGLISKKGLARIDLKRTAMSAEDQTNMMPSTLGSMMLRTGFEYIGTTHNTSLKAVHLPFIKSNDDTAILEFTDFNMRVRVDEAIIGRTSVSTAVTNGDFTSDITSWTDADESGAVSSWAAGGYMSLVGTGFNRAIRYQQVSVGGGDANVEHALRIIVTRGKVYIRVGVTVGSQEYITETLLRPGIHSLAFTPSGSFYVWFSSYTQYASLIDSVNIESTTIGGIIPSPWDEDSLGLIRFIQSVDVIFATGGGYQQRRIERHGTRSWSIVLYEPEDGPFRTVNTGPIRIAPSAINGDITLTSTASLFYPGHVGGLFRITSIGQTVEADLTGDAQFTDPIRVVGVDDARFFTVTRAGTWSGGLTLQRSIDEVGSWVDVASYTTNASASFDDTLDNQIAYYRIGFKTGGYGSGTAEASLSYANGGLTGVVRVTGYNSATSVSAAVLKALGGITASNDWSEGEWSDYRGFPDAVTLDEGRLWQAGKDRIIGSVSDAFESFDDTIEGESAPINRSIGEGPVDSIRWLLPLKSLQIGGEGAEYSAQASSFGEILTATNFGLKAHSTNGSAPVNAAKMDDIGIFVEKSGTRLMYVAYSFEKDGYNCDDLMKWAPDFAKSGIVRVAIQRKPDTRIHIALGDGRAGCLVYDRNEDVNAWIPVVTLGDVEDIVIMPGDVEDKVYYTVKRIIGGNTVRYFERWAQEEECTDGTFVYDGDSSTVISDLPYLDGKAVTVRDSSGVKIGNYTVSDGGITLASAVTYAQITPTLYKLVDSHVVFSGSSATITGLSSLEGEEVVVWADGKDYSPGNGTSQTTYTVASGQITLADSVQSAVVGLAYRGRFKSTKLAYLAEAGMTALGQKKKVNYIGLLLADTHKKGIRYGMDFNNMDELPDVEDEQEVAANHVWPDYDKGLMEFEGEWNTDSRLCLEAHAPRPCTVLGCVISMQMNSKV